MARATTQLLPAAAVLAATAQGQAGTNYAELAFVIAFLVISLGIHEAAHGWVALQCGDPTARDLGRITLNPLPHIDPFMTVLLPAVMYLTVGWIFGGAKPVPVAAHRLRHPLRDMMLVALAGPLSNLLLALVFGAAFNLALRSGRYEMDQLLPGVLFLSMQFNVILAVFNLLPIPPLDGSRVLAWLLPASVRAPFMALERFGLILVFLVVWFVDPVNAVIRQWVAETTRFVLGVTGA